MTDPNGVRVKRQEVADRKRSFTSVSPSNGKSCSGKYFRCYYCCNDAWLDAIFDKACKLPNHSRFTAAYGIAHLDYKFFIGGFYFYIINCMFIGWATYLLTRYFKFQQIFSSKQKIKYVVLWEIAIVLMLLPGLYIAYDKWKAEENKSVQVSDRARIELLEKRLEKLERNSNRQ